MITPKTYNTPDPRWEIFGIESYEAYLTKYVVPGRFSPLVPESVVQEYLKSEHIQAQSYYHYPLYEEALGAALRTIEMAVKNRCKQFNIDSEYRNKKDKKAYFTLNQLIEKLAKREPNKNYVENLSTARELRNLQSHPDLEVNFGFSRANHFMHTINLLNEIFINDDVIGNLNTNANQFVIKLGEQKESYWLYPSGEKDKYLVMESVYCLGSYFVSNEINSLFAFIPSMKDSPEGVVQSPIVISLVDAEVNDKQIVGKTSDGQMLLIKRAPDAMSNILGAEKTEQIDTGLELGKQAIVQHLLAEAKTKFKYKNCWVNSIL